MCLMCIEIAKGKMTLNEARRALPEMVSADQTQEARAHYLELQKATDEELKEKAAQYEATHKR